MAGCIVEHTRYPRAHLFNGFVATLAMWDVRIGLTVERWPTGTLPLFDPLEHVGEHGGPNPVRA